MKWPTKYYEESGEEASIKSPVAAFSADHILQAAKYPGIKVD
jgi:hypothetical protein